MRARRPRPRGVGLLAACLALVGATFAAVPAAALAASVTFGQPQATATYDQRIVFTVDVMTDVPLERVELRLQFPQALGPALVDVTPPKGTGPKTLRYTLDLTGDGHIVPNTPIVATWAAYTAAGADPILSTPETFRYQDTTHEWRSVKGDLMTVH